jgi:hypothetical protein
VGENKFIKMTYIYCKYCQKSKDANDFSPGQLKRNNPKCQLCVSIYNKQYALSHKDDRKIYSKQYYIDNAEAIKAYSTQYRKDHPEWLSEYLEEHKENKKEYDKSYHLLHQEERRLFRRAYNATHKKEKNEWERNKRQNDPSFSLRKNISQLIRWALRKADSDKQGFSILDFLPYSMKELKEHLEKQFEPWMNWRNQGTYKVEEWKDNDPSTWTWQLDHIIPQASLPYTSMDDENFKKCWALDNLRPLSAKQNLTDGLTRIRHNK